MWVWRKMRERDGVCVCVCVSVRVRERKREAEYVFVCERENGREGEIINSWHWGREAQPVWGERVTHTHTHTHKWFCADQQCPQCLKHRIVFFTSYSSCTSIYYMYMFTFRPISLSILLGDSLVDILSACWWNSHYLFLIALSNPKRQAQRVKGKNTSRDTQGDEFFLTTLMKTSVFPMRGVWYYIGTPTAAAAKRDRQSWGECTVCEGNREWFSLSLHCQRCYMQWMYMDHSHISFESFVWLS